MENAEGHFREVLRTPVEEGLRSRYLQLWLFVMRHLPDLVSPSTNYRKQNNGQDSSFLAWDMFRNLCRALDFNTDTLVVNGGLTKEISKFLARIRPTNLYEYNLHDQTNNILAMLNTIQRRPVEPPTGVTPSTTSNAMLQVSHRMGIPHQAYHTTDKKHLFLPTMSIRNSLRNGPSDPYQDVTTFFIKRCFFIFFFCPDYPVEFPTDDILSDGPTSPPNLLPDFSRTLDSQSDEDRHFLGALSRLSGLQSPTSDDMRVILEEAAGSVRASQLVRLQNEADATLSRRSNKRTMHRRATVVIIFFLGKGETVTKHLEPHKSLRSYCEDLSSERLPLRNSEDQLVRYSDAEFILEGVKIAKFHVRPPLTRSGHIEEQEGVAGDTMEKARHRERLGISGCFP